MRIGTAAFGVLAAGGLALAGGLFLAASPRAHAGGEPEVEAKRVFISPAYTVGERFRVERSYRQNTLTVSPEGVRARGASDPLAYDASLQIDALVTIEKVDAKGSALEWSAKFDKLRVDIPDPIQTQEYRLRVRERKQKRLPFNAHPVEGMTLKVEQKEEDGKGARLYRVLKNGQDAGISERFPEVIPLMQSLVDPDWTANEAHTIGGEWEMPADQIFRLTKVLAKTPLEGKIHCKIVSVTDDVANVDFTATLKETYAAVEMVISLEGRIEFDVKRRHTVGSSYKGQVSIASKGSSTGGMGTVSGGSSYTDAVPAGEPDDEKPGK